MVVGETTRSDEWGRPSSGPDRSAFAADMRLVRSREALRRVLDRTLDEMDDSSLRTELDPPNTCTGGSVPAGPR